MFFCGPLTGILGDTYGPRLPLLLGSFLHVFGLMMTSISHEYYQFFLAQSVVSAMGCSFLFFPSKTLHLSSHGLYANIQSTALAAVGQYFTSHRALALGIVVSGSSIGGVILPIMVDRLIPRVGFGWAMRSLAFLLLGLLVIGNVFVKARLPPPKRHFRLIEFITPLTEVPFALLTAGSFFIYLGGFLPFTFVILQARKEGMSAALAGYLVSILNGAS
jgi:MFS family permease